MRIAIDWGYGFTKAVGEDGSMVSFPSVVAKKGETTSDNIMENKEDYTVNICFPGNDSASHLAVGDLGLQIGGIRAWEENFVQNQNLIVLVFTAICVLIKDSLQPVKVAAGLPMAYYSRQKNSVKEMLHGLEVRGSVGGYRSIPRSLRIIDLHIFPQGTGAYYSQILSLDGMVKGAELANSSVGILDIGYRTTDLIVMQRGRKGVTPRQDLTGGIDLGINNSMQALKEQVDKVTGGNIPVPWLEQALLWENGKLSYKGEDFNIAVYQKEVNENLAGKIAQMVKQKWGQEMDRLSCILIAGGGGQSLYPYLQQHIPQARPADNAFYANARGFLAAQALMIRRSDNG